VATLRLFAAARETAGTGRDVVPGDTVAAVLEEAVRRYGEAFAEVLDTSRVWLNGEPAEGPEPVAGADEVAVLPPVSGGCR
jgi:molybdopterin converting factor small subunit